MCLISLFMLASFYTKNTKPKDGIHPVWSYHFSEAFAKCGLIQRLADCRLYKVPEHDWVDFFQRIFNRLLCYNKLSVGDWSHVKNSNVHFIYSRSRHYCVSSTNIQQEYACNLEREFANEIIYQRKWKHTSKAPTTANKEDKLDISISNALQLFLTLPVTIVNRECFFLFFSFFKTG